MTGFTRKTPECGGHYRFSGIAYQTRGVEATLRPVEVWHLTGDLLRAVREEDGLDYLQVFEAPDGRVVWAVDDGCHWTFLLPNEY